MKFLWIIPDNSVRKLWIVLYLIGIIGLLIPFTLPAFKLLIPAMLLLNVVVVLWFQKGWSVLLFLTVFFILVGSFLITWLGIKTGFVMGGLHFGNALAPRFEGIPVVVGVHWLVLVMATHHLLAPVKLYPILSVFVAAWLVVAFDWLLQPVGLRLGLWGWSGAVPIKHYIATFIMAFGFHFVYQKAVGKSKNVIAGYIFIVELFALAMLRIVMVLGVL